MNESFLEENPLALFDDFIAIPDKAFDNPEDINSIQAMIETIMESDDYVRVVSSIHKDNLPLFEEYHEKFKKVYKDAKNGVYGTGKKRDMVLNFFFRSLKMFDEIEATGGAFKNIPIKVARKDKEVILPEYMSLGDAGADIHANETVTINPGETVLVGTGLYVAVLGGYCLDVVPRSGLSLKTGLRVANAPGTIDCGFRNEVKVILTNTSLDQPYTVEKGDRIAQFKLNHVPHIDWKEVSMEEFLEDKTSRGEGFGSSGK